MKIQKSMSWEENGKNMIVEVTRGYEIWDDIIDLDGDIGTLGKKVHEKLEVILKIDGEIIVRRSHAPFLVTRQNTLDYQQVTTNGGYARLGGTFISKNAYTIIMATIGAVETETKIKKATDREYQKVKVVNLRNN